jgi:hypothetical protein
MTLSEQIRAHIRAGARRAWAAASERRRADGGWIVEASDEELDAIVRDVAEAIVEALNTEDLDRRRVIEQVHATAYREYLKAIAVVMSGGVLSEASLAGATEGAGVAAAVALGVQDGRAAPLVKSKSEFLAALEKLVPGATQLADADGKNPS